MGKPMTDIAFELMSKKKTAVVFGKLWEEVSQIRGLTPAQADDKITQFYMDMSLDNRFVSLEGNKWDIRSRHKFEDVVINTDAIMVEDDEDEMEDMEAEDEEKE